MAAILHERWSLGNFWYLETGRSGEESVISLLLESVSSLTKEFIISSEVNIYSNS